MNEKGLSGDVRRSNERIEEGFVDVEKALISLEDVLSQIKNGNIPISDAKQQDQPVRSISELIKQAPIFLAEAANNIREKTTLLKEMVL